MSYDDCLRSFSLIVGLDRSGDAACTPSHSSCLRSPSRLASNRLRSLLVGVVVDLDGKPCAKWTSGFRAGCRLPASGR